MKYLLLLFFFSASLAHAQQWASTYANGQNNYSYNIVLDEQSNSYIVGSTENTILIVKYNSSGVQQWAEVYTHSFPILSSFSSVIKYDNSGSLYLGGGIQNLDTTEAVILLKYNTSGSLIWSKTFDRAGEINTFSNLTLDESGNPYLLCGYYDPAATSAGGEVIRYNQQGDTAWTLKYPDASPSVIITDEFGNSYMTGIVFKNLTLFDCLTYKIDANGNLMWEATYGSNSIDAGRSLCVNKTGDVYVTGVEGSLYDAFIIKYDPDGNLIWERNYNSPGNYDDAGNNILLDDSENIYVAGQTEINDTAARILLLKFNSSGTQIWGRSFSNSNNNLFISDMFVSGNGSIILTGNSLNELFSYSIMTFIYDTDGVLSWQSEYLNSNTDDYTTSLAVDNNKNIYITGSTLNDSGYYNCLTLKYDNPVSISSLSSEIPESFSLKQNYPNPFNPVTKIKFDLASNVKGQTSNVKLIIYDALGKEVETLVNENLSPGSYEVEFDGSNFSSGIYFYRLNSGSLDQTKRMLLIK